MKCPTTCPECYDLPDRCWVCDTPVPINKLTCSDACATELFETSIVVDERFS